MTPLLRYISSIISGGIDTLHCKQWKETLLVFTFEHIFKETLKIIHKQCRKHKAKTNCGEELKSPR